MTTGYKGYRLPGSDWDWHEWDSAHLYTVAELLQEAIGDYLESLGDEPLEPCDIQVDDGSITVVKAIDTPTAPCRLTPAHLCNLNV